jgi:alkylation response protein AidB-like acyl-CoA dehydrogenase
LKSYSTSSAQETARDAVQIFGGRGITMSGMGKFIEHVRAHPSGDGLINSDSFSQYHRTITFDALLGGAEDVLSDLGVRQALRGMPKDARL